MKMECKHNSSLGCYIQTKQQSVKSTNLSLVPYLLRQQSKIKILIGPTKFQNKLSIAHIANLSNQLETATLVPLTIYQVTKIQPEEYDLYKMYYFEDFTLFHV